MLDNNAEQPPSVCVWVGEVEVSILTGAQENSRTARVQGNIVYFG